MTSNAISSLVCAQNGMFTVAQTQSSGSKSDFGQILGEMNSEQKVDTYRESISASRETSAEGKDDSDYKTPVDERKNSNQDINRLVKKKLSETENELVRETLDCVKEKVADKFNLSVEELEGIMNELNLSAEDLLDATSLSLILANAYQQADVMCLVFDENVYNDFKEMVEYVTNVSENLANELGVDVGELDDIISEVVSKETDVKQMPFKEMMEAEQEATLKGEGLDGDEAGVKQDETNATRDARTTTENQMSSVEVGTKTSYASSENDFTGEQDKGNDNNPFSTITGGIEDKLNAILKEEPTFVEGAKSHADMIMKQLIDQIKVNITPSVTEMEIQLHPASLGSVNIQLALKEGQLTAQLAAQNEATKEAIEGQVAQLRETLQAQGIKVEAIEVTIASHQFERNLQQDGSKQNEQSDKKKARKINLNLEQEIEMEELTQDEAISIEMMKANGNQVDYSA